MKKLKQKVKKLTESELAEANSNFPQFASPHEGYAVILEEFEETTHELRNFGFALQSLWAGIKRDEIQLDKLTKLCSIAQNMACESIQTAAMCQKLLDYEEK